MTNHLIDEIHNLRNKTIQEPSPELLNLLLRYEPEAGKLFWRNRPVWMFVNGMQSALHACNKWNSRYTGKHAFTTANNGYRHGDIFGRKYYAHRVIWAMYYGEWPQYQIDHINHVRLDNRVVNLRAVSRQDNMRNSSISQANTSGFTGVHWNKALKKWSAAINTNGNDVHLGLFHNLSDAIDARSAANIKYGFHKNHGY